MCLRPCLGCGWQHISSGQLLILQWLQLTSQQHGADQEDLQHPGRPPARCGSNQRYCKNTNILIQAYIKTGSHEKKIYSIQDTNTYKTNVRMYCMCSGIIQMDTALQAVFKCVFQIIYLHLCVLKGGWKAFYLFFFRFSSFPVAFKWACWIWPNTRTTYPQCLMEPVY